MLTVFFLIKVPSAYLILRFSDIALIVEQRIFQFKTNSSHEVSKLGNFSF